MRPLKVNRARAAAATHGYPGTCSAFHCPPQIRGQASWLRKWSSACFRAIQSKRIRLVRMDRSIRRFCGFPNPIDASYDCQERAFGCASTSVKHVTAANIKMFVAGVVLALRVHAKLPNPPSIARSKRKRPGIPTSTESPVHPNQNPTAASTMPSKANVLGKDAFNGACIPHPPTIGKNKQR